VFRDGLELLLAAKMTSLCHDTPGAIESSPLISKHGEKRIIEARGSEKGWPEFEIQLSWTSAYLSSWLSLCTFELLFRGSFAPCDFPEETKISQQISMYMLCLKTQQEKEGLTTLIATSSLVFKSRPMIDFDELIVST
jgi:hypothetical protein